MPRTTTPAWRKKLEDAAVRYFFDGKRDFSIASLERLAASSAITIPKSVSAKPLQTAIVKRVKDLATVAGVRTDGIKLDGGKPVKVESKYAKRLVALCEKKKWNDARAAKAFGVELRMFRWWVREGKGIGTYRRLLEILESPSTAKVPPERTPKKEPEWQLRTLESRRLLELKKRRGWGVGATAKAFGVGPRTVYHWLHGYMKPTATARKILEHYERKV